MNTKILLYLVFLMSIYACDRKAKLSTEDKIMLDSVNVELIQLEDSMDVAWQRMIADDNEKHQFMKRLLLEITYSNNFNQQTIDSLNNLIDTLKSIRYTDPEALTSKAIDMYDSATMHVTHQLIDYASNHPAHDQFNLIPELIADIRYKNSMILLYRVRYDGFVMQYNHLKRVNAEKALLRDKKFDTTQVPVFQLPV